MPIWFQDIMEFQQWECKNNLKRQRSTNV
jgi:hypothetical protein